MAFEIKKTEHVGAKKGQGFWGKKGDAKHQSNLTRRENAAREVKRAISALDINETSK